MEIERIIYHTTREINNLEDKLSIAVIFLFCEKLGTEKFSELLFTNDHENFLIELNHLYKDYGVDFTIRLNDKNVRNSFLKTLQEVRNKLDDNGFHKAVYEKDEFAIAICQIINYNFSKLEFKKLINKIQIQLSLFD